MAKYITENQTSPIFMVTRQKPELIAPAAPTPYEFKALSDIDDQEGLRLHVPGMQSYSAVPNGRDPAKVIKEAVSKALVPYYPLAGRLRKTDGKHLVVECNGEGIMLIEANADITLAELGEALLPPYPYMKEFLCDVPGGVLDSPLFLIQVTRLRCGGFIFAHQINHVMADGTGLAQFVTAVAELARGAQFLSVYPVWKRHLLSARDPPHVTYEHREYDQIEDVPLGPDMVHKSFFFGATEIAILRRYLPAHLKSSSTFEVLTAFIWRSRTTALQFNPDDEVRVRIYVNTRHKFNPPLPSGYYGNAIATPMAISTAGSLCSNPVSYALELVKSTKNNIGEEYMRSLADFLALNGKPRNTRARVFSVSDVSRVGLDMFDFGWGKAVHGGPARGWLGGPTPGYGSFFLSGKNSKGESGILVPMDLPRLAMERFEEELNGYLNDFPDLQIADSGPSIKGSAFGIVKGAGAVCA